nr:chitobiosyldiphosphodolichol beta-mannosyltransferase [Onthophagus taurus]
MALKKKICVVVLGDIGRSPRMQYHSESFAEQGDIVDIVCYRETLPKSTLIAQPLVSFHYLAPYPTLMLPKFLNYVFKTLWQAINLLFVLLITRKPDIVLVQNPPAVPALLVCWVFSLICGAKYVIDWHNYAYSIMALNVGKNNVLVKVTKKIEEFIGRRATNLCVTKEMKKDLMENWGIRATTLYDRPSDVFHSITLEEKHSLLKKLSSKYECLGSPSEDETVISNLEDNKVILKENRPGIIISSTSWTEDEDFSILLKALINYENHIKEDNIKQLPNLICIITGKGPLKSYYLNKINQLELKHIKIITPWLEAEDYPKIIASADLGVSLHTSSSGLDLPMKVVDMFGCGIPVCAYDFKSLYELVKHEENGFVFKDAEELSDQIQSWFQEFPNNKIQNNQKEAFLNEINNFRELGWRENWNMIASSVFE